MCRDAYFVFPPPVVNISVTSYFYAPPPVRITMLLIMFLRFSNNFANPCFVAMSHSRFSAACVCEFSVKYEWRCAISGFASHVLWLFCENMCSETVDRCVTLTLIVFCAFPQNFEIDLYRCLMFGISLRVNSTFSVNLGVRVRPLCKTKNVSVL